jgi:uncharacterized protein DUF2630
MAAAASPACPPGARPAPVVTLLLSQTAGAGSPFLVVYGRPMSDESILNRIEALVDEEHKLLRREQDDATDDDALADDRGRLEQVSVELDRCWDLLRQRRARRAAGVDPDGAQVRDAGTVENYRQ